MSVELDKFFDKAAAGLAITPRELGEAAPDQAAVEKLAAFLEARGYVRTVRAMNAVWVKQRRIER